MGLGQGIESDSGGNREEKKKEKEKPLLPMKNREKRAYLHLSYFVLQGKEKLLIS